MIEKTTSCCGPIHFQRRTLLRAAGLSGIGWLTPLAERLTLAADRSTDAKKPAKSVIVLWMQGGPSQLETFDPKPGTNLAGGTKSRKTKVKEIQIADDYEQLADQMDHVSLVRSVVSKEGDHERATYAVKTGFRPDPTLVHPSLGAIICHQLSDSVEIPRHISILPGQWPARGGYLGAQFDAFKVFDPQGPIPDIKPVVDDKRFQQRISDLAVLENEFARGRLKQLEGNKTLHTATTQSALRMMSSDQLKAFDVKQESAEWQRAFGDSPFGRGCLAAARLISVGVRCVEVTLDGWDSHINNHETHKTRAKSLDPAFAALLRYLHEHNLLESTAVLWGGEFGRTPTINPTGGRDHWPHGFTVALAGGGIKGGRVIGETSAELPAESKTWEQFVKDPRQVSDIHATVLQALGVDFQEELTTPIGRPMKLSEGKVISELLS